ncbi:XdhC family protein [Celeribacter neptunius]|uniref:Xanthine dehydrogenase accessory factor n=1 Tax=Celeribacter neptunius TaxID=588602 RepID=A0A1I3VNK9_9RHOB|nr:XdhC family protein [Celeribacter neptunius]SFJ95827.1 xanthine dehydrogenase accessory factor [Celeribacter neptunius]
MNELHRTERTAQTEIPTTIQVCETDVPLRVFARDDALRDDLCLAIVTGVEGPSYRPLGAAMVISETGHHWGTLSSGCIEDDVILHARGALASGQGKRLRYGRGSPFMDLQLPCGGGLDITLIPRPEPLVITDALAGLSARRPIRVTITRDNRLVSGRLARGAQTGGQTFELHPRPRLVIFGKGPEARALFEMANATDIEAVLYSPDINPETEATPQAYPFTGPGWPDTVKLDARSAVALFFHDHDKEPPLLAHALSSPAFYVGALGSAAAHATRERALAALDLPWERIDRMVKPFGLVAHARAPHAIAAGVLAQVFEYAKLD